MKLGRSKLKVKKVLNNKIILTDNKEEIKLKEFEKNLNPGDEIEVFVYDSSNERIATLKKPYVEVGEIGKLKVISKTKYGYFVDIGLDKDIFLPFQERKGRIIVGEKYLMQLYIDRSDRFCVTMDIKNKLALNNKFKVNDEVKGIIYDIDELGAKVAINGKYDGLILKEELKGIYRVGEEIEARVQRILKNGKITLTVREKSYKQMHIDADFLLELLEDNNGILELGDKSDPELVKNITGLSKKAFKKAEGALYKRKLIEIYPEKIVLIKK
ncbi:CvfB family protein [Peptoniphilus catoniae]|uniref:CvfB family protein n=1 Tax=Peptoniphilus catoniae TaxID=1660341 RepID=UPI0010FD04DF|nr:S1-like domain-containing RNA-binding protein [Peptoniphilus catoniae]